MELIITAKQIGKKHATIENKVIEIEDIGTQPSVRDLISAVVKQQVTAYKSRAKAHNLLPFLDTNAIDDQAATGKVGFKSIYSESEPDIDKAVGVAIQAFSDGMFVIFADETQLNLPESIFYLRKETVITFIRLTFLAGSYW